MKETLLKLIKLSGLKMFIQSIFYPFGSGIVAKNLIQNRWFDFSKSKGLPNSPAPLKRPLHTLSILLSIHEKRGHLRNRSPGVI